MSRDVESEQAIGSNEHSTDLSVFLRKRRTNPDAQDLFGKDHQSQRRNQAHDASHDGNLLEPGARDRVRRCQARGDPWKDRLQRGRLDSMDELGKLHAYAVARQIRCSEDGPNDESVDDGEEQSSQALHPHPLPEPEKIQHGRHCRRGQHATPLQRSLRRTSFDKGLQYAYGGADPEGGDHVSREPCRPDNCTNPDDAHADLDLGREVEALRTSKNAGEDPIDFLESQQRDAQKQGGGDFARSTHASEDGLSKQRGKCSAERDQECPTHERDAQRSARRFDRLMRAVCSEMFCDVLRRGYADTEGCKPAKAGDSQRKRPESEAGFAEAVEQER